MEDLQYPQVIDPRGRVVYDVNDYDVPVDPATLTGDTECCQ